MAKTETEIWRGTEAAARRIYQTTTNPLSRQFSEKALVELALKETLLDTPLEEIDLSVVEPIKRMGMFVVVYGLATASWETESGQFLLLPGDRYLNLHMPPPLEGSSISQLLRLSTQSYNAIAEYVSKNDLPIKYVFGITYGKLARTGRREKYVIERLNLPEDLRTEAEGVYGQFLSRGENDVLGEVFICHHTKETFLQEFPRKLD